MRYFSRFILFGVLVFLAGCVSDTAGLTAAYREIQGETMGTYYRVTFRDSTDRDFKTGIDSLLAAINMEVSTWIDSSLISRFNQSADSVIVSRQRKHFLLNLREARRVYRLTDGAFDPTVMPLVNYWGFGYEGRKPVTEVDSHRIDSLMQFVGMDKITLIEGDPMVVRKSLPGVQLDFSGIAKGYGVDAIGAWLQERGLGHYLVDIGGEVKAQGRSPRGDDWRVGINLPEETAGLQEIQTSTPLRNRAIATSGNYRNYYEVNGTKYSHEINPATGFPERSTLLSASVFAADCMTADAFATAFMIMGTERAYKTASRLSGVEAYFIFSKTDGEMGIRYTEGLNGIFEGSTASAN